MIGAIIGDIAASTWEKDKETFFQHLINPDFTSEELQQLMGVSVFCHKYGALDNVCYVDSFRENKNNAGLIDAIACGWMASSIDECNEAIDRLSTKKEVRYARHILSQLIFALRHGDTKRRAINVHHKVEFNYILDYHGIDDLGPIGYLVRAWKCFESSFDFGSALHAAVKLPGDVHLNCILVGALADAMYGHRLYIRKRKYVSADNEIIQVIDVRLNDKLKEFEQSSWKNRTFYPKNDAFTNVERHFWKVVPDHPISKIHFSKEARRRMLKSFDTGWENRFGLYWDDGWFYIYRSHFVLGRFRLALNTDGTYSITQLQRSEEKVEQDIDTILNSIIHSTLRDWERFGDEDAATTIKHMFRFFHGEDEAPYEMGDERGKWWLWEKMVWGHFEDKNQPRISDWWYPAPDFWEKELPGYCSEELRMLDFFYNMHAKWIPYYDPFDAIKDEYFKL